MSESEFVFIHSTFPDEAAARRMGEALVAAKLAACVNIHAPMISIYEWQGKTEIGSEVAAFVKTRRGLVDKVIEIARALHPYSVPCFLVLAIDSGNEDYLAWARRQTT